jgi:hypothetical protein
MSTVYEEARYTPVPGLWEIVRTVSGLAIVLGVAAVLVFGVVLRDDSSRLSASTERPAVSDSLPPPSQPLHFFVSSGEEARRLEEQLRQTRIEVANLGLPPSEDSYRIVVLGEP